MIVLDTSAVLAFVYAEPGHELVKEELVNGRISAANWSETLQKIAFEGGDPHRGGLQLEALGLLVEPLTAADAAHAATLYPLTRKAGLSLGDRCCLALGHRLQIPVLTADRAWLELTDINVGVKTIR